MPRVAALVAWLAMAALCALLAVTVPHAQARDAAVAAPESPGSEAPATDPPADSPPVTRSEGGVPVLRISVDNGPTHFQVKALRRFAEDVRHRLAGRLRVEVYDSASLYRDRDVLQALNLGRVEMALPGTWVLHSVVPDCGVFMLPAFYGAPARASLAVADGPPGRIIDARIERNLRVTVLGRWLELGHANLYLVDRAVRRHEDLAGLRIRVAGGPANELRLAAMGARPLVVPWPDLPHWLQGGNLDGLMTTHETAVSGQLWRYGVSHVFEDRAYFAMYVPLVSRTFWERLPEDMRDVLRDAWEDHVAEARAQAAEAQAEAREALRIQGVVFSVPDDAVLRRWRERLRLGEREVVDFVGVDPTLYEIARSTAWQAEQNPQK
ncbi:TRAP transporter substrate-binding protein DctP [Nitratidesulfovibrio sp. SRB-5]|uniref:TRAP transporter substrate-binding protein DctP n=1 Tax=Nitratidesulfovibrio sp. SRB-5 TaxID=2872636 RepID=UPI0010277188|nr:TRAP transporter substrate-binding protein DctP [Nitratidesulfovibrio sp. SRB-5]MBZ2172599.1 TRAP transporter substrate-binding protein DctP [Nitratidesulfovibrio sp. SRB-5]RXF77431.1 C4-dicarboxylate ABC transporter substrate-binding protein [Desulfovibrio sp. DS-1]